MRPSHVIPAVVAITAIAGCGGGSGGGSGAAGGGYRQAAPAQQPAAKPGTVKIADFKFAPEKVTVQAGTKLTFVNDDDANHTATAQDKSFDTKTLGKGGTASVTLNKPGTYKYYCAFHRFMEGEIDVK
jgi:plastocyanin